MVSVMDGVVSVSYTHLDVYKRQSLYCVGVVNDEKHTFLKREMWSTRRAFLVAEIGIVTPDNVVGTMLVIKDTCNTLRRGLLCAMKSNLYNM